MYVRMYVCTNKHNTNEEACFLQSNQIVTWLYHLCCDARIEEEYPHIGFHIWLDGESVQGTRTAQKVVVNYNKSMQTILSHNHNEKKY